MLDVDLHPALEIRLISGFCVSPCILGTRLFEGLFNGNLRSVTGFGGAQTSASTGAYVKPASIRPAAVMLGRGRFCLQRFICLQNSRMST